MKKIVSFVLLIASIVNCNAQDNDSILINQVTINTFLFQQTVSSLVSIIGNPSSISNYTNEIDNEIWLDYKYSENSFYFYNNYLVSFNLRNDAYYFYSPSIKVGNNINEINTVFPNSYAQREILNDLGYIIVDIKMSNNSISDTFIVINYDTISNCIISIHLGTK